MKTRTTSACSLLVELLRALPVDVEQYVAALVEHRVDGRARRTVAMIEDVRPFEERVVRDHLLECRRIDEMIILAVHLAGADRPRRGGDRQLDLPVGLDQLARDRRLARPRGRGDHEQHAAALHLDLVGAATIRIGRL